jgi:hypothetical protein
MTQLSSLIYFNERYCKIYYIEDAPQFLRCNWQIESPDDSRYKKALEKLNFLIKSKSCPFVLVDNRNLEVTLSEETQSWAATTWISKLVANGGKKLVFIEKNDISPQKIQELTDFWKNKAENALQVFITANADEAVKWLRSV